MNGVSEIGGGGGDEHLRRLGDSGSSDLLPETEHSKYDSGDVVVGGGSPFYFGGPRKPGER